MSSRKISEQKPAGKRILKLFSFAAAFLLLCISRIHADTVITRDGKTYEGRISRYSDTQIQIRSADGSTVIIAKDDIKNVIFETKKDELPADKPSDLPEKPDSSPTEPYRTRSNIRDDARTYALVGSVIFPGIGEILQNRVVTGFILALLGTESWIYSSNERKRADHLYNFYNFYTPVLLLAYRANPVPPDQNPIYLTSVLNLKSIRAEARRHRINSGRGMAAYILTYAFSLADVWVYGKFFIDKSPVSNTYQNHVEFAAVFRF